MPRPPFTRQALQSFVVTSSTQINARSWTTWDSFPWLIEANKRTGDLSEKLLLNETRLHWRSLFPTIKITSITRGNIYDNMSWRASSNLKFIFCLFVLFCFVLFFSSIFSFRGRSLRRIEPVLCQWTLQGPHNPSLILVRYKVQNMLVLKRLID